MTLMRMQSILDSPNSLLPYCPKNPISLSSPKCHTKHQQTPLETTEIILSMAVIRYQNLLLPSSFLISPPSISPFPFYPDIYLLLP